MGYRPPIRKQEPAITFDDSPGPYGDRVLRKFMELQRRYDAAKEVLQEISDELGPVKEEAIAIVKQLDEQQARIGDLIIAYTKKAKTTRSYKPAFEELAEGFERALEKIDIATRETLQAEIDVKEILERHTERGTTESLTFKQEGLMEGLSGSISRALENLLAIVTDAADEMEAMIADMGSLKRKRTDQMVEKRLQGARRRVRKQDIDEHIQLETGEMIVTMGQSGETLYVLEGTNPIMFRTITDEDEKERFRQWGRDHANEEIKNFYHPLTQDAMLRARGMVKADGESLGKILTRRGTR